MRPVSISGNRVRLRDMTHGDLPAWAAWMMPDNAWHRLDGPYYPKPTASEVKAMVAAANANINAGDWPVPRRRLVIADSERDALMGMVTSTWESRETNWLLIGIVLFDPESWGRGLGYEALGLWSDYLFVMMPQLARLDLRTWAGNHGMMKLAQKLGYQEEARFRKARIVDGDYYDGLGYGILREEWNARYPDGFAASLPIG